MLEGSSGGGSGAREGSATLRCTSRWGFLAARRISDWVRCFLRALEGEEKNNSFK